MASSIENKNNPINQFINRSTVQPLQMFIFPKKMVSISHLTVTSTRKLNNLISSNVSSSLRVEVLITNLLAGLEKGDYCEMDCSDLEDEEPLDINATLAYEPKRGQSRYIEEEEEEEEEEEDDELELEESRSGESSRLSRGSPLRQGLSRKRPVEEEEEEESDDEEFGWRASPSAKERSSRAVSLDEIQIQVADEETLSKPIDLKKTPLVLRLKVPPCITPESSEEIQTIQVSPPPSEISFFSLNEEVDPFEVLEAPEPLEPLSHPVDLTSNLQEKKAESIGKRKREEEEEEEEETEEQEKEMMKRMVDLDNGIQRILSPLSPLKKQRIEAEVDRKH